MSRRRSGWLPWLLLGLVVVLLGAGGKGEPYQVRQVMDGDTIMVERADQTILVRLVGVDAPETEHSKALASRARWHRRTPQEEAARGELALAWVARLVEPGRMVRLVADPFQPTKDRYGRLLAHVFLPDGSHLNRLLIGQGYALAYRKFQYDQKGDFLALEKKARQEGKGLWSLPGGP